MRRELGTSFPARVFYDSYPCARASRFVGDVDEDGTKSTDTCRGLPSWSHVHRPRHHRRLDPQAPRPGLKINNVLERFGDLASNIASRARKMEALTATRKAHIDFQGAEAKVRTVLGASSSVSLNLKILGDNFRNVAEDVLYMVGGEIVRHSKVEWSPQRLSLPTRAGDSSTILRFGDSISLGEFKHLSRRFIERQQAKDISGPPSLPGNATC